MLNMHMAPCVGDVVWHKVVSEKKVFKNLQERS